MSNVRVVSQQQRIVVNPATQAISVINSGPIGPQGLPGPPGANGAAIAYEHVQTILSTSWVINHNLEFKPSVDVYDNNGVSIEGHIIHHTDNQVEIQLLTPRAGSARLS